ncbi:helix-hairpin-helix domain-containing protein [Paludicola sp. MB14-C6]|uniref:ComEA family DNA-binding protein n=1 Tax=Paludihabitans sp. MB14-C6 TaxID=3070656 RepID=UPI0027DBC52F|nr:helix-hairpin-helix domain-containing protein [Paludicola sp. MB14-C6]WMJ23095.1 helix-hairpin-helix domain-containing protein [Paludicola sp. MB14-C6]
MKASHYLFVLYILATICICLIVYVVADSKSTIIRTNANEGYTYWEEVASSSNDDYRLIISSNADLSSGDNHTQTASSHTYKSDASTGEIYYQTPENETKQPSPNNKDANVSSKNAPTTSSKSTSSKVTSSKPQEYTGIVNLNTGTFEQLCSLDGIGEVLSQRIIEYRKAHGPFKTIEGILKVSGIGDKKFTAIKNRITV